MLSAKLAGMMMDFDRLSRVVTDLDNNHAKTINYMRTRGSVHSANEHLIPEQLFDDPSTPTKEAEGVSAVKALQMAASQGQKIYTITQNNLSQVLPLLSHKAVIMNDLKNAVAAGKEVTISERSVTVGSWTGTGYVIIDPTSGAGAYMIGGGADGGFLKFMNDNGNGFAFAAGVLATGASLPYFIAALSVIFIVGFLVALGQNLALAEQGCPESYLMANIVFTEIAFLLGAIAKTKVDSAVRALMGWVYTSISPAAGKLCNYHM